MTAPSNANTSGLAPCPFCGGEAWLNDYEAKYSDLPPMSRAPQCRSCGASLGYLTTPAKATEAWNRRVTSASAQARISGLQREVAVAVATADHMADRATEAEARADRLAKALEPFVRHGRACGAFGEDAGPFWIMTDSGHRDVPVDDFRVARAALQQETQP
ncbi:Lar family restriction alleviation protein [Brevundimonas sp. KM4]|uniref:Lar family restriction alleviation protein n=1 Tax=Brevundimonas sp. KM4 TaxID=1628191 RepID=UPI0009E1DA79|nr:Lar family restriction alleviation protein [Brevundimonas sp. KM4]